MKKNTLSKFMMAVSMAAFLMACSEQLKEKKIIVVPTTPTVVAPIVIEKETVVKKEPKTNSTKVTFDKNGVKVEVEKVEVMIK